MRCSCPYTKEGPVLHPGGSSKSVEGCCETPKCMCCELCWTKSSCCSGDVLLRHAKFKWHAGKSDDQMCCACDMNSDTDGHRLRNCSALWNMCMDSEMLYIMLLALESAVLIVLKLFHGSQSASHRKSTRIFQTWTDNRGNAA